MRVSVLAATLAQTWRCLLPRFEQRSQVVQPSDSQWIIRRGRSFRSLLRTGLKRAVPRRVYGHLRQDREGKSPATLRHAICSRNRCRRISWTRCTSSNKNFRSEVVASCLVQDCFLVHGKQYQHDECRQARLRQGLADVASGAPRRARNT